MIEKIHTSHTGIENSLKLTKQNLFWPGMTREITEKIRYCEICQRHSNSSQKLPMMSSPIPEHPWQVIPMDVCFAEHQEKNRKILVFVDHYLDYFKASFLKDLKPTTVISCLKETFSRFGIPELLIFGHALSPVQRLMSRQTRQGLSSINLKMKDVTKNIEDRHKHSKLYCDRNTKSSPALSLRDKVNVQLKPNTDRVWSRGHVEQRSSERSYLVSQNGKHYIGNKVNVKLRQETEENSVSVESSESVNINK
ncbi:hypothetical protein ILUMI_02264 [Ignelater luminosus]|uniref:RNA-directed DNA polymerase n=1 Tax=Ignelater luminosus TaxID=2038154 RepID=A0A8K0GJF5_IGNLU|nr:hypothetical protein ILUMI_02264 [Ignelater luminosus]